MMIPNYLKTAWRNWKKNKGFFTLNFVGLYVSVIASILIALLIFHETSFDRSGDNGLAVYRVVDQQTSPKGKDYTAVTPYPLATAMRTAMPDQALISQIRFRKTAYSPSTIKISRKPTSSLPKVPFSPGCFRSP